MLIKKVSQLEAGKVGFKRKYFTVFEAIIIIIIICFFKEKTGFLFVAWAVDRLLVQIYKCCSILLIQLAPKLLRRIMLFI